jgi:predicted alpha/beta superfamily hydrolase
MSDTIADRWKDYVSPAGVPFRHVAGSLKVLPSVYSTQLANRRDILVYLPPSYAAGDQHYPVIYMHDAQNLFDPATSFAGEVWRVDETLTALSYQGLEAIAVGVPHAGEQRMHEYNPFDRGDAYLAFIVDTLRPIINHDFRSLAERSQTGIMGSSLGGLISLYAFFRYPHVFGLAGALSPALWVQRGSINEYVRAAPFSPGRIYIDNGTQEANAQGMYQRLLHKGYRADVDVKYVSEEGGQHRESAWARRLPDALRFLLKG